MYAIRILSFRLHAMLFQMAKQYNMVIVSPILERDEVHGEVLANTAGLLRYFDSISFSLL